MNLKAIVTTQRGVFIHETTHMDQNLFLEDILEKHKNDTQCQIKITRIRPYTDSSAR